MVMDDEGWEWMLKEFICFLKCEEVIWVKFVRFVVVYEKVKMKNIIIWFKDSYFFINKKWKDYCLFFDEFMKECGFFFFEFYVMFGVIYFVVMFGVVVLIIFVVEEIFNFCLNCCCGLGGDIVVIDVEFEEILVGFVDNVFKDLNFRVLKIVVVIFDMIVG